MGYYCPGIPFGPLHEDLMYLLPERKVNLNRRIACPVGEYLDYTGASALSDCKDCERGRYTDWYGQSACKLCPTGKYVDTFRSSEVYDCDTCLPGHYCPQGSEFPLACDKGEYARYPGMGARSECLSCPKGHYCPVGSVEPTPCPAGYFTNQTRTVGSGYYPGTYLKDGIMTGHSCTLCPTGFFCPIGSSVPTSCPAGTHSAEGTEREADCIECPVGYKCQSLASTDYAQSLVVREANLEQMVGCPTASIAVCDVDTTVHHHSYPNITGCLEHCPYQIPHQSYCHIAGDGRFPQRRRGERNIMELIALRSEMGRTSLSVQQDALDDMNFTLSEILSEAERIEVFRAVDKNGRTALMLASMNGDVEAVGVLLMHGADPKMARDVSGFTAVMLAARMGHTAVVEVLEQADRPANIAPQDSLRLTDLGVDTSTMQTGPLTVSTKYLGRGGLSWDANHPVNPSWLQNTTG